MKLKKINKIKKFLKLIYAYPDYIKLFKEIKIQTNKRCILIGTPIHGNLGDSLIAQQCIEFLKNRYNYVLEIPEFFYEIFSEKIKFCENDDIYICGGGWMGDLYEDELVIEDVIKRWPNNKKIILPQTISFSGTGKFSSIGRLKMILEKDKKTIICVREEKSYHICINELALSSNKCILLPDMGLLALKNVDLKKNELKRVIFSCRNDVEKNTNDNDIINSRNYLIDKGYECIDSSTVISKKVVKLKEREIIIENKIKEYSQASIVITDRLHSMVFALLAGCKCIAIDNSTHKVLGVYQKWLSNIPGLWVLKISSQLSKEIIDQCIGYEKKPYLICFKDNFIVLDKMVEKL